MVSTYPLIFGSFSFFIKPLGIVPSVPITAGITVIFTFHGYLFSFLARSRYLSLFSFSFIFALWSAGTAKSTLWLVRFFFFFSFFFFFVLLTITRSGHLAEIWWSVCISRSHRILCVSFSRTDSRLRIYLLFFHNSQWISLPTQSCLVLH